MSVTLLRRWLALSRTRLFVAVLVPAIIGAAVAFRQGSFAWGYFVLTAFGLVMAEMMNLTLGDWAGYKGIDLSRGSATPPPLIEGSPTLPEWLLPLRYSVYLALVCGGLAGTVFVYLLWQLGWQLRWRHWSH